ncbi:hypothetical protein [Klebsiella pneumoniae]|uniref:hypothetical protein n=1 Tax=Klebsiella pneumoniae TaxID=573 RepID=UPI00275DE022|nr:hypothetical protein [Klebsiella pneumoniae]MDP8580204.1 hypothetical protein [Klebsiella pneumoniae subsp. pneumoniae]
MTSKLTREELLNIIETDHVQCGEASALARIALAAMDSEPVAWTDEAELRDVDRGGCGYLFTVNPVTPHADERRIILLYRHAQQPAAVVLQEMTADGIIDMHECGYVEGWNACRAAMLQSGNSPVIPGGLIGAVNRLLDSDGSRGCYSAIRCGDAHDEIERLLAAAPQEVK